ncbi:hypothetical protein [Maribellus sediminis]|uniref:hypothetical protein n=1 Tax=Maribellus sediminis TaxID=2696285 RepID=UPI00142F9CB6|nr:hypothetical protein [Maribellus sediminis]
MAKLNKMVITEQLINERIVIEIETDCKLVTIKSKTRGKLILTKKKLFFANEEGRILETFNLAQIHSLNIRKWFGLFSKDIFFGHENSYYTIKVQFPKDWKSLIDRQISMLKA